MKHTVTHHHVSALDYPQDEIRGQTKLQHYGGREEIRSRAEPFVRAGATN
jgi:hypothetical protein